MLALSTNSIENDAHSVSFHRLCWSQASELTRRLEAGGCCRSRKAAKHTAIPVKVRAKQTEPRATVHRTMRGRDPRNK